MKIHKKVGILVAGVALSAAIVGMSACSLIVSAIDDADETGDSVAGNYTFDMSLYDEEFQDHTMDSVMGGVYVGMIADRGISQTNTLVLTSDLNYTYTKDLVLATEGNSWYCHFVYTFYGTYTFAGTTATLGPATSAAYEVEISSVVSQGSNLDVDYTETTDLTLDAGFFGGGATLADVLYGPYVRNSGTGNVSQVVYIGDYEWGDFDFADNGLTSTSTSSEPEESDAAGVIYEFEPTGESAYASYFTFSLSLYDDYTYKFGAVFESYGMDLSEEGAWAYDEDTRTITLISGGKTVATAVAEDDGTISVTYSCYVESFGMDVGETFLGTVEELTAAIGAAQS